MALQKTMKIRRNVVSSEKTVQSKEKSKTFITEHELQLLLKGANKTRYPLRNQAIILTMFWHGLRVSELCNLKKADLEIQTGRLFVKRLKNGLSTTHTIRPEVLRTLKRYLKQSESAGRYLFINERGDPFTRYPINYMLKQASKYSPLPFAVNPHMLRHGCGFALANRGLDTRLIQDYLGHRDISNTTIYTQTSMKRFEAIWD